MSKAPSIPNTSQIERYREFVAGLQKTPPAKTEFKIGQIVAYANDYGVIFPGHEIIGFADPDEYFFTEYGKFIYLNLDCYWCSQAPGSLRVMDEDGNFEIRQGEVVYEDGVINTDDSSATKEQDDTNPGETMKPVLAEVGDTVRIIVGNVVLEVEITQNAAGRPDAKVTNRTLGDDR